MWTRRDTNLKRRHLLFNCSVLSPIPNVAVILTSVALLCLCNLPFLVALQTGFDMREMLPLVYAQSLR